MTDSVVVRRGPTIGDEAGKVVWTVVVKGLVTVTKDTLASKDVHPANGQCQSGEF